MLPIVTPMYTSSDRQPSHIAVGTIGIICVVGVVTLIVVSDAGRLFSQLKYFWKTVVRLVRKWSTSGRVAAVATSAATATADRDALHHVTVAAHDVAVTVIKVEAQDVTANEATANDVTENDVTQNDNTANDVT